VILVLFHCKTNLCMFINFFINFIPHTNSNGDEWLAIVLLKMYCYGMFWVKQFRFVNTTAKDYYDLQIRYFTTIKVQTVANIINISISHNLFSWRWMSSMETCSSTVINDVTDSGFRLFVVFMPPPFEE